MAKNQSWKEYVAAQNSRLGIKDRPLTAKQTEPPKQIQLSAAPKHSTPSPGSGHMNKLEASYAAHLEVRRMVGEITRWRFEPLKLRLAPSTYYNVDFVVYFADGRIEIHETKGFWRDDARVKIKVAAAMFDEFTFVAVVWEKKTGWKFETFKA
jgi:hypothetical protein